MDRLLSKLNAPQREAVIHKNGPLLVLAGAGSGKTTTMATRIAYLIAKHHISARSILGLSFTRKAAKELKERVVKMVTKTSGPKAAEGLLISTFHALCVRMLRRNASVLGYSPEFTILDDSDQTSIVKEILKQIKVDDRKFDSDFIRFEIGQAKNRFLVGDAARDFFLNGRRMPEDYAIITAEVFEHYQARLKTLNSLDFDDLLFQAVRMLEEHPEVCDQYNHLFRYILVDEYQDTNPAQFRLLSALTRRTQNLCVVGDDDQSIYAWRGADPAHILQFSHHFPEARTITLDQNYRSTNTILEAANEVIAKNRHRHPKKLWSDQGQGQPLTQLILEDDQAEAIAVAEEILKRKNDERLSRQWADFAILYRSNPQSRIFEEALRLRKIPYKIVGTLSFLERKEVKDALCYLRLIVNPSDDPSFRRVCNWPARSFGRTALDKIGDLAHEKQMPLYEVARNREWLAPLMTAKTLGGVGSFLSAVDRARDSLRATAPTREAMAAWLKQTYLDLGFKTAILEEEEDPVRGERRWENVAELANAIGQFDAEPVEGVELTPERVVLEFLARMTLESLDDEDEDSDKKKDEVTLLTLHGAKGLEYPVVFLVGMEEGLLPHRRTIEEGLDFSEERRLCYVGITRAKQELLLTRTKNRIRYGKKVPRTPSRFLQEIPEKLMVLQDESENPEPTTKQAQEEHEAKVKDFLSQIRARIT